MSAHDMNLSVSGEVLELSVEIAVGDADTSSDTFFEGIAEIYCIEYTGTVGYFGLLMTYCFRNLDFWNLKKRSDRIQCKQNERKR